ncbi:MAG: TonB-dependent receptor plug domain-containing protein [Gemmatimonadota bacterium]
MRPFPGACIVLLTCPAFLLAQAPSRVTGRILDTTDAAPLALAEISLGARLVTSRADGSFDLGSVSPGRYQLRIRRVGYSPSEQSLDVEPATDRNVEVRLLPSPIQLDSIAVTAAGQGIVLDGEDAVRRGSDLSKSLDGWEGLVVRRSGGSGAAAPQLRGGSPDELLVLVDGFSINDPLTGRADLSRIPSSQVREVRLLPGAQSVRAGSRAVTGVLSIETRTHLAPESSAWLASYGALGGHAAATLGGFALSFSGERLPNQYGYDVAPGGAQATRENAGGNVWNGSIHSSGRVEFVARGSASDHGIPGISNNPTLHAQGSDRSLLLGLRTLGAIELSGTVEGLSTRFQDSAPPAPRAPYDSRTRGLGASLALHTSRALSAGVWRGAFTYGGDARYDAFEGDQVQPGSNFYRGSLRADARLSPGAGSHFSLAPAIRLDDWKNRSAPALSLRLDAEWHLGGTTVTAALGNGVTTPVLADLFFREQNGVAINPDLRPERTLWEAEAGIRREGRVLRMPATASVRAFAGRLDDMILWSVRPASGFVWTPGNFDVRRLGGEASLALHPSRTFSLQGTSTWAAVTVLVPGHYQVLYRPRVTHSASVGWSPGAWELDVRWHFVGRRFPNSAGQNPLAAYAVADAGVERRVGALLLRAELDDIANRRPAFIAGFPTPGRSVRATLTMELP